MEEGGRAEVAWIIGAHGQGHGYGSEAAAAMVHALIRAGVPWVTAHVHPDHAASEGSGASLSPDADRGFPGRGTTLGMAICRLIPDLWTRNLGQAELGGLRDDGAPVGQGHLREDRRDVVVGGLG